MLLTSRSAAINGETILKSRPQKLASPAAVPLIGAGNASGVHPYRTALNIDWKKYSYAHDKVNFIFQARELGKSLRTIAFNPIFEASVSTVAKRNSDIPIKAEDPTIA